MKTRLFISLSALFSLSACSHVKIVEFDKKADTVSIEIGSYDTQMDAQKKAEEYCGGTVSLLSMSEKVIGSSSSGSAYSSRGIGVGSKTKYNMTRNVFLFACEKKK